MQHATYLFAAVLLSGVALAEDSGPAVLTTHPVSPGLVVLIGPGGNVAVGYGADSVAIVDTGGADLAPQVREVIAQIDPRPVKFVIDTNWHFDHAGGNAEFARAGATIIGQLNVQRRMAAGGASAAGTTQSASTSTIALPTHTYLDVRTIAAGGDLLRLVHVERAHTDGDTIVKWTRADVLHTGDVYVSNGLPFVDLASGGSLAGVIAAVETALSLSDDRTVIIPGHGELATRSDLIEYRDRLNTIAAAVAAEIRKGKPLAAIQALRLADSWPRQAGAPVEPDAFIAMAYESCMHPL